MVQRALRLIVILSTLAVVYRTGHVVLLMLNPKHMMSAEHRRLDTYQFLAVGPQGPLRGDAGEPLRFETQAAANEYRDAYPACR